MKGVWLPFICPGCCRILVSKGSALVDVELGQQDVLDVLLVSRPRHGDGGGGGL